MARGIIDHDGLNRDDIRRLREARTPDDLPFDLGKISHVVLKVADLERSVRFYTEVLGLRVSDAYPESMMPGRMVFLRCNDDHHGVALVGGAREDSKSKELHHFAFEVGSLDEVFHAREHLQRHGVALDFQGRRRAGQQFALEFQDPDGHRLEICWGMDRIKPHESSRPAEKWREAFSLEDAVRDAPPGQDTSLADRSLLKVG
ncbi:MAG: VOC family protein [Alphaproteobacteria bacterium]|jgi:catechol 2,3-dioxygenase|nr:VOC family protein [Alphaproteobacteria bacterium]MDP6566313.1 VOC family protein [Alphaproteobacteria bacterium]MDP6815455.1 VOC family protein [Alphaproteobacteria bacterium]